ncbi:MAG: type II toxin-antitoxin system VapC family toxin [Candidatus Nanopelagicales bacterium]|nr:type II toxin-antitoxin system VapC family toxin [Candidatus Nanopelagicales bacterium]
MSLVVDASLVVSALVDSGSVGAWAVDRLAEGALAAPHLLPVEVANVLRRAAIAGQLSEDAATLAHEDLANLRIDYFDYAPFAPRIWDLRGTVSAYGAWYVALAEVIDAPLGTLDRKLASAPGPRCRFLLPGE